MLYKTGEGFQITVTHICAGCYTQLHCACFLSWLLCCTMSAWEIASANKKPSVLFGKSQLLLYSIWFMYVWGRLALLLLYHDN